MVNGQPLIYIDTKGEEVPAQVLSFRNDPVFELDGDGKPTDRIIHNQPRVTVSVPGPMPGHSQTLHDLVHHTHPSKDENNPAMPRIPLHCWKYPNEEHVTPAKDHPVHDKPFVPPLTDRKGAVIPTPRPHHEAHVREHQNSQGIEPSPLPVFVPETVTASAGFNSGLPDPTEHHPGNPESVHYRSKCVLCHEDVIRLAHHQGGAEFNPEPIADGSYVKHATTCKGVPPQPPTAEEAKPPEPTSSHAPVNPLTLEGEVTFEKLAEHFPVLSVLYDAPDVTTYRGVEAKLPNGHSHVVKANGVEQDFKDALVFCHANGHRTHLQSMSVAQFRTDAEAHERKLQEDEEKRRAAAAAGPTVEEQSTQGAEPDVIAELEAAGPSPVVEEEKKPDDPA